VAGAFVPVIDMVVPFDDIVEAHRRVDTGHKAGSVVVAMTSTGYENAARPEQNAHEESAA
jgi:hypothetical protein